MPQKMTTTLFDRAGRLCRLCRLGILLLLAGLAGCGPGTGGTGTGPIQGVLTFSGTIGSAAVSVPGNQVTLQLEAERVELRAACRRFVHIGAWEVNDDGKLVLEGTVDTMSAAGTTSAAATLQLQFSEREPASPQVTVILTGAGAAVLVGPAVLQREESTMGALPPDCGTAP